MTENARKTPSGARSNKGMPEGGPPESQGRSLDYSGNAETRGMAVDPPEATSLGNKTRLIVRSGMFYSFAAERLISGVVFNCMFC